MTLAEYFGSLEGKTPGEVALGLAVNFGFKVMPTHAMRRIDRKMRCSCGETCTKPGKHPLILKGVTAASSEPEQVKAWMAKWPWANWAWSLEDTGLAALDVDVAKGKEGDKRLVELLAGTPLPETLVVATPSGGKHIYFKERQEVPSKSNSLGDGLDTWKGKHYLMLPGCNHELGGKYVVEMAKEPRDWPDILLPRRGPGRPRGGKNPNAGAPVTKEHLDINDKDDVSRLMHALTYVNCEDRDTWVHVGYCLARLFHWTNEGWQLYREWAEKAKNYNEKESHNIYYRDSHNPPDNLALTTAYIFKRASENANFQRWEKSDSRLKFFEDVGHEDEGMRVLTGLVAQSDLPMYEREGRLIDIIRIERMTDEEKARLKAQGVHREDAYCITRQLESGQFVLKASEKIAWWAKRNGKMRLSNFNRVVVRDFLMLGGWPGMKRFRAFTLHPTIRSLEDPTIIEEGFDRESGIFPQPNGPKLALRPRPNRKDAKAALRVLLSPFEHYAFIDGDYSKAVLVALILTIGIRHCFKTAPMFIATSPVVGSGKTKLMQAPAAIWYGAESPAMVFVENEEEMEKRIGASVMAGDRVLLFDNVMAERAVNDKTLNTMLTSGACEFRILGESSKVRMSAPMTVMMTGNRMHLGIDLGRRALEMKVDPQGPLPTARKFPFEPIKFASTNCKVLQAAALDIIRAFLADNVPLSSPIASFEEWTRIRDLVVWLDLPDVAEGGFGANNEPDEDDRPAVLKRFIQMLLSLKLDTDGCDLVGKDKKKRPADLIPLLMAKGPAWQDLFAAACDAYNYGADGERQPQLDNPKSVNTVLLLLLDQDVEIDGQLVRLKARDDKKAPFWLVVRPLVKT